MDSLSKRVVYLTIIVLLITPILLNTQVTSVVEAESSYTVVDVLGHVFVFNEIPRRVVSLAPSITEIIFALGKQDVLIGVDTISYDDPHFNINIYVREKGLANVGGYWWTLVDIQKIIELNPDLVIADYGAHKPLLDTFKEYGIKAFYLYGGSARNLYEVYSDILRIGSVFNDTDTAHKLVESIESEFKKYSDILKNFRSVRLLFIIGLNGGIWVAGRETFINDVITRLGLINVVDKEGWVSLSIEDLYKLSPDAIIVASMFDFEYTFKLVEEHDLYSITPKIYVLKPVETDYFLRPSPLIINAPKLIYSLLEHWGFRKTPPVSEFNYLPLVVIVVFIIVFSVERIRK